MQSAPDLQPHREQLLELARGSIRHGTEHGRPLPVALAGYPDSLTRPGASFVTLHKQGQLRGCIGSLEPRQALVRDVAENAWAGAFRDPRFAPVAAEELPLLQIAISVLTPQTPIAFSSEADLLAQLRPFEDGLVLKEGPCRGTFLPSVWEQLPERREFLRHLKLKAGLSADYFSSTLQVYRYGTLSFEE